MAQQSDEDTVKDGFWPKLTRHAARIPFAGEALAAYFCATDSTTPVKVKATLFGALAYFILPIDVVPDIILGLGFTDDMAVLITAVTLMRNHITQAHRTRAHEILDTLKSEIDASARSPHV